MTQAMNLANFSNYLDASGQVAPTVLNAPVPVSKGGTGAASASAARTNLDVAQAVYSVPAGGIIMWSGSIASIPTGWLLCNGTSGTPDLRNRFVIGAGSTYAVASTGGSADAIVVSHTHTATVTDPGHFHGIGTTTASLATNSNQAYPVGANATVNSQTKVTGITVDNSTTGGSGTNANLPPYYALAFIMKS